MNYLKRGYETRSFTLTLPTQVYDLVLQYAESMSLSRSMAALALLDAGIKVTMFKRSHKVVKKDSKGL